MSLLSPLRDKFTVREAPARAVPTGRLFHSSRPTLFEQIGNPKMKTLLRLLIALFVLATPTLAQTTAITGTFKAPSGLSPLDAGIASVATINGVQVYGRADFDPYDVSGATATRIVCNGVTYLPQTVHGWILGDGTLAANDAASNIALIPTKGCQPQNLVYRAVYLLNGSTDHRIAAVSWTEFKEVPQASLVDWASLSAVTVSKSAFSYVLQNQGTILDYLNWVGISGPPDPITGNGHVWIDSTTGKLFCRYNTGAGVIDCNPGYTSEVTFNLENPTSADSGKFQWKPLHALSFTRITCNVDSGTVNINLEVRAESLPNNSGTAVLSSSLSCAPNTTAAVTFSSASVPGNSPVALVITGTNGAPTIVRIHAEYQITN
jgi:hypothetical protein